MDEQAVGTPQCDWIETDYSFPFSYVSRDIERMGITTAFVQGKSDTRPKTSIHETFPISWEWENVSLHHSFAVSWTQLLIKCDYSVCNGKTVRSVRVQKVLVAHQETETLSAVTVLPIGNSQKIVSVSSHSFHALEGARQGHCQKYVLILFIKPEKKRLWCLDVVIPFALIRTKVAVCQLYQISPPKRLEFSVMSTFKELPLVFTAE